MVAHLRMHDLVQALLQLVGNGRLGLVNRARVVEGRAPGAGRGRIRMNGEGGRFMESRVRHGRGGSQESEDWDTRKEFGEEKRKDIRHSHRAAEL